MKSLSQRIIQSVAAGLNENSLEVVSPLWFLSLPTPTTAEQQLKCASYWSKHTRTFTQSIQRSSDLASRQRLKLRIGYLSADYRRHAVGYLIPELFEAHDRSQFEVYAYSIGHDDGSEIRQRIASTSNQFRDLQRHSHIEAAEQIASDGIDILVDLQGHTQFARTAILAQRPAPIQVSYLGYPSTMGAEFVDYILVDDCVVPSSQQPLIPSASFTCPVATWSTIAIARCQPRNLRERKWDFPSSDLPFAQFSTPYKITRQMYEIWMNLLKQVPESFPLVANRSRASASKPLPPGRGIRHRSRSTDFCTTRPDGRALGETVRRRSHARHLSVQSTFDGQRCIASRFAAAYSFRKTFSSRVSGSLLEPSACRNW